MFIETCMGIYFKIATFSDNALAIQYLNVSCIYNIGSGLFKQQNGKPIGFCALLRHRVQVLHIDGSNRCVKWSIPVTISISNDDLNNMHLLCCLQNRHSKSKAAISPSPMPVVPDVLVRTNYGATSDIKADAMTMPGCPPIDRRILTDKKTYST